MTDETNVRHLPEPGVILDLDTEQRDPKDVKPPFVVKIGGRSVTFKDPSEIDWRDLAAVDIPADLIRVSLTREDRMHIQDQDMPSWKFGRLMEAYYEHYEIEEKIRNAKRQAQFSV